MSNFVRFMDTLHVNQKQAYKVLITTSRYIIAYTKLGTPNGVMLGEHAAGAGVAVHTTIAEFESEKSAQAAVDKINTQPDREGFQQVALYLGQ